MASRTFRSSHFPILILAATLILGIGCSGEKSDPLKDTRFSPKGRSVPSFNADTAFAFVKRQVAFGPRNPNSEGHRQAADYLITTLSHYAGRRAVFTQRFKEEGYGETLDLVNIIAAFNLNASDRIMLCAHWDTRPRADMDSLRTEEPISGADDGGSGVAVLLELARQFSQKMPPIGVDIVLFDGEDYGKSGSLDHYFLGSRYWAEHPPVVGYSPRFSILLDMVGGKNATFPKERYSLRYAEKLVDEVWQIADNKGYDTLFLDQVGQAISDDHVIINQKLGIPTIDIINHQTDPVDGRIRFAPYWHTHRDDLDNIDPNTLQAVGEVLMELIYNRM